MWILCMLIWKVLHHALLFLCILNFKYLWDLEKNYPIKLEFQRMFDILITVVSVKDWWFWEKKPFLFKNNVFGPKMHNNHN